MEEINQKREKENVKSTKGMTQKSFNFLEKICNFSGEDFQYVHNYHNLSMCGF